MTKLTAAEAAALYRAVEAEHVSKRAASDALEQFGSVDVFNHLKESATRHITTLCNTLNSFGAAGPVLAPVPEQRYDSLVAALEAAAERETETAAIYDEILQQSSSESLKRVVLPLWQSVSHLHLAAITDQLAIEDPSRRQLR